jgi:hypothetical protein
MHYGEKTPTARNLAAFKQGAQVWLADLGLSLFAVFLLPQIFRI